MEYYANTLSSEDRLGDVASLKLITMIEVIVEIRQRVVEQVDRLSLDSFSKESESWEDFERVLQTLEEGQNNGLSPLVR